MNNQYDSLIFDLDGTLWDVTEACAEAWNLVIERNKISFPKVNAEQLKKVTGKPHEEGIRIIFEGLSESEINILNQQTMEENNKMIQKLGGTIYPGVKEGLDQLLKQYPLFIVSNCPQGYIEIFLELNHFQSYFKDIECWGNTKKTKAINILDLMSRNQLNSPLYIGDTLGDQLASKICQIPFAHVTYGFGTCKDADMTVGTFQELVNNLIS